MWLLKGKIVNIQATTQNFIVALFYKINSVHNTTIIAENTKNLLNSGPHTIDITIQIGEKFSPIVNQKFWHFLKCQGYCHTTITNCSYAKFQKEQLIAHKVYCERKHTKVLQTYDFPFICKLYDFRCHKHN